MGNGIEKATITGVPQGGPLSVTIRRVNEIIRGWINYFRIGMMKQFMKELGKWLRHKIRVIVIKQWKTPKTIYRNLYYLNRKQNKGWGGGKLSSLYPIFPARPFPLQVQGKDVILSILNWMG